MSSKTQSPGPSATTSQVPKQARSRKAEAATGQNTNTGGRAGSAGGIIIKNETAKNTTSSGVNPSTTAKKQSASGPVTASKKQVERSTTSPLGKEEDGADTSNLTSSTGTSNKPRRRPRKLNRDAPTEDTSPTAAASSTAATDATAPTAPTAELEALKSRVRGLEAKVEELYKSSDSRNRSPRRRGKGRKNSSAQSVPTLNNTTTEMNEEEADEELVRAEEELESARRDLEIFQPRNPRPKAKRNTSGESDYIEEVPRDDTDNTSYNTEGRQVTLTGSYRIPLPSTLDMKDVKTIQSGVSAAQNVARSFLEQRRANRAASSSSNTTTSQASAKLSPKPSRKTSGMEITKETDGKSWGEWFGGYSMAISRAVKSIEAEAAIENQRAQAGTDPAGGPRRTAGGGKRPARGRQSEGVA